MARTTDVITISLPKKVRKELVQIARREARSQSEVLRDAFRFWQASKELDRFQEVGEAIALRLGIERDDDVEQFLRRRP